MFEHARLTLAVEGPSDSGKSALVSHLASHFGTDALELPCYVDMAGASRLPAARAASVEEAIEGLDFYLDLDRRRADLDAGTPGQVVIADRCWLTLLAHIYAVEHAGGPNAFKPARERVGASAAELYQPGLVLVLAVDPNVRAGRINAVDRGQWFTDPTYNRLFDNFMETVAPDLMPGKLVRIDGDASAEEVARAAVATIDGQSEKS